MSIRRIIKNTKFLSPIVYRARREYYTFLQKQYGKEPLNRKRILFSNFNGRGYGCNPRAIAEKMHSMRPDYELLWVCNNKAAEHTLPRYVKPVAFESKEYFRALATSGTWVFNLTAQDYIVKREGQFYIQTWHGDRAFKKILHDAEELDSFKKWMKNVQLREDELCDCCMSGSVFGTRVYHSAFLYNGWVLEVGQPRNDVLVNVDPEYAGKIRKRLGIEDDVKILMYAPTFRDHLKTQGTTNSNIQLDLIIDALKKQTGSKWVVLLRAHSGHKLDLNNKIDSNEFLDVTLYPDMADLLVVTDFLITDYSSSAPDFALTGRPILLYQDDIDDYVSKDRTMWFKMDESPYLHARSMEEAIEIIRTMTPESAAHNDKDILDFYETRESGESSRIICEEIIRRAEA